jgi:hypothetical protein
MEPLKPEDREFILENNPQASPEELEEYEQLLSMRFTQDPDLPAEPTLEVTANVRESRLTELYEKLIRPLGETALGPRE